VPKGQYKQKLFYEDIVSPKIATKIVRISALASKKEVKSKK
jgi:hypothetical protein